MHDDEDRPQRPTLQVAKPALDRLNIEDLHTYIAALKAEIMRAEVAITNKQGHRQAADALFRIQD